MQPLGTIEAPVEDQNRRKLRILVVEDNVNLAAEMSASLVSAGHDLVVVDDGLAALDASAASPFDVMVVDRLLPNLNGESLVRALRTRGIGTPVLFVTALGTIAERVAGLECGADDYLVKPFAFEELHARIKALGRRNPGSEAEPIRLRCSELLMNRIERTVFWAGTEVDLLPLEYRLLEVLLLNAGQPVTRMMLLEQVWGFRFDPRTNIVETNISRMRGKLEEAGGERLIRTVRGAGYVIMPPSPTEP
jgi:two-component system OmpR family response regulator